MWIPNMLGSETFHVKEDYKMCLNDHFKIESNDLF